MLKSWHFCRRTKACNEIMWYVQAMLSMCVCVSERRQVVRMSVGARVVVAQVLFPKRALLLLGACKYAKLGTETEAVWWLGPKQPHLTNQPTTAAFPFLHVAWVFVGADTEEGLMSVVPLKWVSCACDMLSIAHFISALRKSWHIKRN